MAVDGLISPTAGAAGPLQVLLNVYDVSQGDGKGTVVRLNNLVGPKGLGLGGVFHGAVVLGTVEFSFGFCEQGTGVYAVKAGMNPMYTFRETIDLGPTQKTMQEIRSIIQQLKQEWPGSSYDLLYRNCCHFCVDLAARLEVGPVPGWLNRFASGAAATINMTQDTVKTVQEFGAEVGRFWNRTLAAASYQQQQLAEKLQQQQQNWRNGSGANHHQQQQQQQQDRGGGGDSPTAMRSTGRTSQTGQQIWSGLTAAGQQIRATTSKLAQQAAVAAKGSGGSGGPRFGSLSLASMSLASSAPPYAGWLAGDEAPHAQQQQQQGQQQQQQPREAGSWGQQQPAPAGTASAASAAAADAASAAADGSKPLQGTQGSVGPGDRASLLLGAQPKLSKQYRLSAGGPHPFASDPAAARAAASSGGGSRLQPCGSDDGLMPFLSVDDEADPFVALVGDDDAEDDAQQKAAVENAVLHSPATVPN